MPKGHRHRLHLTGLYGHTAAERPSLADYLGEAQNLLGMLSTIASAPIAPDAW